jgi:tRNA dimethylallyltransferase
MATPRLVVIVGQTASGKSALAMELARQFDGEIICADSRTVYRGMDIGTAKPSAEDRAKVPHHLLDVVDPDERFTVVEFKRLTEVAITDISVRGKLPIMVGGTGLYVDSVLFDYQFSVEGSERDPANPRHLKQTDVTPKILRPNTLVLGLSVNKALLEQRIHDRVEYMVASGFVDEVRAISDKYGWQAAALLAPGYKAFHGYLDGSADLETAKAAFVRNDTQLAKRQRTWFRRNKHIQWLDNPRSAVDLVTTFLNT